ncbi:hypothetical protein GCM10008967_36010 [Bacillus carboniphilus]|uniref:Uncharacterized protein n=1 Tax=Bacillus carboniphilus TaxID=86663 RepID=A0ABN0WN56_9BACI
MLDVSSPEIPPTIKSLPGVALTLTWNINKSVRLNKMRLTTNLNVLRLIEKYNKTPKGTPTMLPIINLLRTEKSMSFLILRMRSIEMNKDNTIFI